LKFFKLHLNRYRNLFGCLMIDSLKDCPRILSPLFFYFIFMFFFFFFVEIIRVLYIHIFLRWQNSLIYSSNQKANGWESQREIRVLKVHWYGMLWNIIWNKIESVNYIAVLWLTGRFVKLVRYFDQTHKDHQYEGYFLVLATRLF